MTSGYLGGESETIDLLEPGQPFSRVDRFSRFEGHYEAMQNLVIEGSCSGEIDCRGTLVVAEGALVNAKVTARDIRVAGRVDGELECSGKFELMPSGRASGSVIARQIVVHEGAQYEGEMQMRGAAAFEDPDVAEPELDAEPAAKPLTAWASATPAPVGQPAVMDDADALPDVHGDDAKDVPDFLRPRRGE